VRFEQAARYFDAGAFSLVWRHGAARHVAIKLGQLVTVDLHVEFGRRAGRVTRGRKERIAQRYHDDQSGQGGEDPETHVSSREKSHIRLAAYAAPQNPP
jgi:hypothetical protein